MSDLYHSLKHSTIHENIEISEIQKYILNFEKSNEIQEKMLEIVECFVEENQLVVSELGNQFQCNDDYVNLGIDLTMIPRDLLVLLYKFLTLHASSMAVDLQRLTACEA